MRLRAHLKGEPARRASTPMLYRRFEQLIDIFRDAPSAAPPDKVLPFYLYYLRQVWPCFAALLVVGLIGSLIEVALFSYLSRIIDLAQGTPPANFFQDPQRRADLDGRGRPAAAPDFRRPA